MNSERNVSRTAENAGAVSAQVSHRRRVHEKREAHGEVLRALSSERVASNRVVRSREMRKQREILLKYSIIDKSQKPKEKIMLEYNSTANPPPRRLRVVVDVSRQTTCVHKTLESTRRDPHASSRPFRHDASRRPSPSLLTRRHHSSSSQSSCYTHRRFLPSSHQWRSHLLSS